MSDQAAQRSDVDVGVPLTVVASMDDVDQSVGHSPLINDGHIHVYATDSDDVEGHMPRCGHCG